MAFPIVLSSVTPVNSEVSPDQLAWLNDSPSNDLADGYPGPGWDAPRYEPTRAAEAQEAGYLRGYQLDWRAQPSADLDDLLKLCWLVGKVQGAADRQHDEAERDAFEHDLAESAFRGIDGSHPDEVTRAVGILAARAIGGAR